MKKEDATYGYDKKGNSLNPKDKKKAMKKEEAECCPKCGKMDCKEHVDVKKEGYGGSSSKGKKYVNKKVAKIMSYKK